MSINNQIGMINTLRIIVEQCSEYQSSVYLDFVDFEKAFDSINRDSIWKALHEFEVPTKIINLIREFYKNYRCQIIPEGKLSGPFEIGIGDKQGCLLSPIIFFMVLDKVMRKSTSRQRGL